MITRASFRHFKALRNLSVELAPFTVFAGRNGTGKSSLLRAIQMAHDLRFASIRDLFVRWNNAIHLLSRGENFPIEINLAGRWGGKDGALEIRVQDIHRDDASNDWAAKCSVRVGWDGEVRSESDTTPLAEFAPAFHSQMQHGVRLQLDCRALSAAAAPEGPDPLLRWNGANLAAILADMKLSRPEAFQELQTALIRVVPEVRQVRLKPAPVEKLERLEVKAADGRPVLSEVPTQIWGHQVYFDFAGAPDVPAFEASEGTLLALALLTVMVGEPRPRLLLLDDLERGLHPLAQASLIAQLRALQLRNPALQIVATSHSPYLLDHFRPEEVRLLSAAEDGSVSCGRLVDHPEFARWRDGMASGELWSAVGEKWVTERVGRHE